MRDFSREPVRVLIVDDSALMRKLLASALGGQPDLAVVGAAADAVEAEELIRAQAPDVVTLDVALPGMSGIDFLQRIMERRPIPVVMVSSLTAEGAETSLAALELGAVDVVEKPRGPDALRGFPPLLQAKVRAAAASSPDRSGRPGRSPTTRSAVPAAGVASRRLIAIGASTGGVSALSKLLAGLPDGLPPIVIVQHMPTGYPERFATRLGRQLGRDVGEAADGEALATGMIRVAPGERHLTVIRRPGRLETALVDAAPVSGHRPSADVLFESVARAVGRWALGVVLTGMGRDGAAGLATMRRSGAVCVGQGPESSVVYGMARAAREAGGIDEEVELPELPARICQFLNP
jgi:two-component system, chemotaxis family, protein-glutamate methylesterase/glutaminase